MRILVTGCKGYIGSVLVKELIDKGYSVIGIDIGYYEECLLLNEFSLYEYKNKDLDKIITSSKKFNCKIITTEKDYLRIDNQIKKEIQFVKSELIIIDEEKFIKQII